MRSNRATKKSSEKWVILAQSHYPAFQEMMDDLADTIGCGLLLSGCGQDELARNLSVVRMPAYDRGTLLRRAFSWAKYEVQALSKFAENRGKPFVLAVTNPPLNTQLVWALSRIKGIKYGLLIWDVYPDALYKNEILSKGNPVIRVWNRMNSEAMIGAEFVVTLGEKMKRVLEEKLGRRAGETRFEVIPNWVDTNVILPVEKNRNPFVAEHGLEKKTTVMYSGNLGAGHGVEILPAAAASLKGSGNLRFLVVGSGLGLKEVKREISRLEVNNMTLLPPQPWSVFPSVAAAADIAVVFQRPGLEDISMPSKTYTAMAAGSAILAVTKEDSDLANLVRENGIGTIVEANPAAVADGLKNLASNKDKLEEMKRRARDAAVRDYDTEVIRKRWNDLLSDYAGL